MAARILDPDRFILAGAVVDWTLAARRHGKDVNAIVGQRKVGPGVVQLRWMLDPKLGLPSQAFQVWQRVHSDGGTLATPPDNLQTYQSFAGAKVYAWDTPLVFVRGTLTVSGSGAYIAAYAGAPFAGAAVDLITVANGTHDVSLSGPAIGSLAVIGGDNLTNLVGFDSHNAANDPAWKPVEIVGLPVDPQAWAGVFGWPKDQGPVGAPTDPATAALDRYRRGAPFFGWDDLIEAGHPAPSWIDADPKAIIEAMRKDVLDDLRTMIATLPPDRHIDFTVNHTLPLQGGSQPAAANFAPISALMLGVTSDPLLSLIGGFGTAFDYVSKPGTEGQPGAAGANPGVSPYDFMVTAVYEKGLDGQSAAEEYAAIVCRPTRPFPVPKPANLAALLEGLTAPDARDQRRRALVRLSWDQIPQATPFRVASYAAARYGLAPVAGTQPLMGPRQGDPNKALQPISATTSAEVAQATGQLRAIDETYAVDPAVAPNQLRYGIAHQDLFGQWSGWSTADAAASEPNPQTARLLAAALDTTAPASGSVCDATLSVDFSWDWTDRAPKQITLVGRLYATTKPGLPPADLSLPGGLPTAFPGGPGTLLTIPFNGGDAGTPPPGAALRYFGDDMKSLQSTPLVVAGTRRYRLTIPAATAAPLKLDFATTGHIGLALWAQGQENMAPQRTGAWSPEPLLASASDPRPPVVTAIHEDVKLASLPDAKGEHRARVEWDPMPGAAGYFVYETTESKLRVESGLGEPAPGLTLSDRLLALRDAFHANPQRTPFTRMNSTALTGTATEVVIERGSKEIHLYLVLGASAGQVESAWPSLADPDRRKRFVAFAAPQVVPPAPPKLEAVRQTVTIGGNTAYRARLKLETRPGAAVTRLDLYRVRVPEAALELDTMGPPLARIAGADPAWQVVSTTGAGPGQAQTLGIVTGTDNPSGSWKRVFYRAVAIAADNPSRGVYGSRSAPSNTAWIVVPPDTGPDLSAITADWPGGPLEAVRFSFTSAAPVAVTDLGPHRLRITASTLQADGLLAPLFAWPPPPSNAAAADNSLSAIPDSEAPAPAVWREDQASAARYRVSLVRPALGDTVRIRVLMVDPLGRATEQVFDSPGGAPLPAPDIVSPRVVTSGPNRFVLGFSTHALFTTTPLGPYTLNVVALPRQSGIGPRPVPISVTAPLPSIAAVGLGQDPFADHAQIPLRQSHGQIAVYLRAQANVALTLLAPDGRSAHVSVGVP